MPGWWNDEIRWPTQSSENMHPVIVIHRQQWDAYSKLAKDVDGLGTVCGLLTQDVDGC